MVWFFPEHAASARSGAPSAASTMSEAEASSAGRVFLKVGCKNHEEEFVESSRPLSRVARVNLRARIPPSSLKVDRLTLPLRHSMSTRVPASPFATRRYVTLSQE